jgi:hypothetical protein
VSENLDQELDVWTGAELREELKRLRMHLRIHHAERGHSRCRYSDLNLYRQLPEYRDLVSFEQELPQCRDEWMHNCGAYYDSHACQMEQLKLRTGEVYFDALAYVPVIHAQRPLAAAWMQGFGIRIAAATFADGRTKLRFAKKPSEQYAAAFDRQVYPAGELCLVLDGNPLTWQI